MRNVSRTPEPTSLSSGKEEWTRGLLQVRLALHQAESNEAEKVTLDKLKKNVKTAEKKYNQSDVKEALRTMYNNQCCYCEGEIETVSYSEIEHLKPKSKFPNQTFEWSNLHLVCEICNKKKSNQYSDIHPILDPTMNESIIGNHITFEPIGDGVSCRAHSERAKTTIDHAQINRSELKSARLSIYIEALPLIREIKENKGKPSVETTIDRLKEMQKKSFGSVITDLVRWTGL